jgi:hypothetical protein
MKTITGSTSTFLPSSPLIGGSAHVPLGGSTRLLGDTSPSKGMAPFGRAGDSAALPVSGAEERKMEVHGDLHQKFANLRDEMKRQRGQAASVIGLGDRSLSMTTSALFGDRGLGL